MCGAGGHAYPTLDTVGDKVGVACVWSHCFAIASLPVVVSGHWWRRLTMTTHHFKHSAHVPGQHSPTCQLANWCIGQSWQDTKLRLTQSRSLSHSLSWLVMMNTCLATNGERNEAHQKPRTETARCIWCWCCANCAIIVALEHACVCLNEFTCLSCLSSAPVVCECATRQLPSQHYSKLSIIHSHLLLPFNWHIVCKLTMRLQSSVRRLFGRALQRSKLVFDLSSLKSCLVAAATLLLRSLYSLHLTL